MAPLDHDELDRSLTNQAPSGPAVIAAFEALRVEAKKFGHIVLSICPPGEARDQALVRLQESLMWSVKAIALDQEFVERRSDNRSE